MKKTFLFAVGCSLLFLLVSFLTLKNYGISWDETIHFRRGQAFLHYFLTGRSDYSNLNQVRRSLYQSDFHNGDFFLKKDVGHPPLNDELAAFFNYIFFQKLGVLDDVFSHHLFNILASGFLIFVVTYFASEHLGIFAGGVTFLAIATYPLFWAESHFNIKDPPEAAFYIACIWAFHKFLDKYKPIWLVASMVFWGIALSIKFNAIFLPLTLLIYIFIRFKFKWVFVTKKTIRAFLIGLTLALAIFFISWPPLWQKFPDYLFEVFGYYRQVGTLTNYQPDSFYLLGFNSFPILGIIFTTPPLTLLFLLLGMISVFLNRKEPTKTAFLWLLIFAIPIIRVSMPGSSIYGGVRQILEFLPGLALLAGLGARQIRSLPRIKFIIIALFIWPLLTLVRLHPNENVYFNFLIGGLRGAQSVNFPAWGNSFGNAYLQGIKWLNSNAENGAKVSLLQGTPSNAPPIFFRRDINYLVGGNIDSRETYFSGIERGGEYLMELTYNDVSKTFNYAWDYVEKFLNPVYELKVDGVPILKIWKNDIVNTKPEFRFGEKDSSGYVSYSPQSDIIQIDLGEKLLLSRLILKSDNASTCSQPSMIFIETSQDGDEWKREADAIPAYQIRRTLNYNGGTIAFFFAGTKARYLRMLLNENRECTFKDHAPRILILE